MAEDKGEAYLAQGQKILGKFSLFGSGTKFEDAAECFESAGNQFKIAKKWSRAGNAYVKVAEMNLKTNDKAGGARYYQTAAAAYRKENSAEAVKYYEMAVSMLCDSGKFSSAAKIQKEIGELYEAEDKTDEAITSYRQAAEYYTGENQATSANSCFLKVAQFSAVLERFEDAMHLYEQVGAACMESNLLKFNAKGHLLNAGMCALATNDRDVVSTKLAAYEDIDFAFADSREGKLLTTLVSAYECYDTDAFADAVYQFDSISKLDQWKVSVLLKIKESMVTIGDEAMSLT